MQPGASSEQKAYPEKAVSVRIQSVWGVAFTVSCVLQILSGCAGVARNSPDFSDERPTEKSDKAVSNQDPQQPQAENAPHPPQAPGALITPRIKPTRAEIHTRTQFAGIPEKPSLLLGMSDQSITEIFGAPHGIEHNGASVIWNYRTSNCALQIVFYQDIEDETFHALQYALTDGNGEPPDEAASCLESIRVSNDHG